MRPWFDWIPIICLFTRFFPLIRGYVATPNNVAQCSVQIISWNSDGSGPFTISIHDAFSAAILFSFPPTFDDSISWTVNLTSGTSIQYCVAQPDGTLDYSGNFDVTGGSSTCLGFTSIASTPTSTTTTRPSTTHKTPSVSITNPTMTTRSGRTTHRRLMTPPSSEG